MQRSSERRVRSANSTLAATTLSHTMQHLFVGSSIIFPFIIAELNLNYTEFGIVMAVSSLIGGLFQIFFGGISRRISRHILLGLGNIILALGMFIVGIAHNIIDFLVSRVVANIGVAPQHPMGTAIITNKFKSKSIGRAIGIHYGVAYLGNIVGPVVITLLQNVMDWRSTLFIFSALSFIVGSFVIWYLKGDNEITNPEGEVEISSFRSDLVTLFKTKTVLPIIAAEALISAGVDLVVITIYAPLFLADPNGLNLDPNIRGIIYTIGLVGGVLGPIVLGRYADRMGHLKLATISTGSAFILVYSLTLYDSVNLLLPLHLFTLGFVSFSLPTLLQAHLVRATREYGRDIIVGLFFASNVTFNALWLGIIGFLIDHYSSFKPAFVFMGTLGLIATVLLANQVMKTA